MRPHKTLSTKCGVHAKRGVFVLHTRAVVVVLRWNPRGAAIAALQRGWSIHICSQLLPESFILDAKKYNVVCGGGGARGAHSNNRARACTQCTRRLHALTRPVCVHKNTVHYIICRGLFSTVVVFSFLSLSRHETAKNPPYHTNACMCSMGCVTCVSVVWCVFRTWSSDCNCIIRCLWWALSDELKYPFA